MTSSNSVPDGPLFRAVLKALEIRATSLRKSTKALSVALSSSISALQTNSVAQNLIDDHLELLSISSTVKSDITSVRTQTKLKRKKELIDSIELNELLSNSIERLSLLVSPKKVFEEQSKLYYDATSKFLSKIELDSHKLSILDSKQAERKTKFETIRLDYYNMLESLVESEEVNIAIWLKTWSGVEESTGSTFTSEESRPKSRSQQLSSVARSLSASITYRDVVNGEGDSDIDSEGEDEEGDASVSGGSNFSQLGGVVQAARKRRISIPSFSTEKEKEPERKRDRLKIFLKQSLGSTSSHSDPPRSPTLLEPPSSPTFPSSANHSSTSSSAADRLPSPPVVDKVIVPPLTPKQELASQARKREGFLFSSLKPVSHTTVGDGGGHYHKLWCVLSEGQLIEFSNWRTALVVANPPFNLKFATARLSRNSDRRFVFEIITQSSRRLYQATSEEEANDWVTAINKSVESLLNGTSSVRHFDASRLTGSSTPFSLHDFGSTTSLVSRHPSGSSDPPSSHASSSSLGGNVGGLSNLLPSWMAPNSSANQISRKISLSGGGKRLQKEKGPLLLSPSIDLISSRFPPPINRTPSPRRQTVSTVAETAGSPSNSSILDSSTTSNTSGASSQIRSTSGSGSDDIALGSGVGGEFQVVNLSEHDQRIEELVFNLAGPSISPEEISRRKMKNAQSIHELAEKEGNSTCCECGGSESNWSSWSLGIFLCIRCSGIHRSLGTHISKVRSVELDDWNDEQLASMQKVGNVKAKEYWEARRPEGILVNDSTITAFIKNKYIEKIWIPLSSLDSTSFLASSTSSNSLPVGSLESTPKSSDLLTGVLKAVGLGL